MNNDLIKAVQAKSEIKLTNAQAKNILDVVFDSIIEQTKKTGEVQIVGFGKFYKKVIKAHTGRNPLTGAAIKVPVKRSIAWKASITAKNAMK